MAGNVQSKTMDRVRCVLGYSSNAAFKYAFAAFMVLISTWLIGRIMEAVYGNTVFDPVLTRWLGISIWILLLIWIVGWGIGSIKELSGAEKRRHVIVSWVFLVILMAAGLYDLEGFRISSAGLFTALSGATESSQQAFFQLLKQHPANPMLAANLIASELTGAGIPGPSAGYVWSSNILFAFFIWSFAYGVLLLMHKNNVWPKAVHLALAACSLWILIILKSVFSTTMDQMIMLHATAATLLVFQVLLTYSTLRAYGEPAEEVRENSDPFSVHPDPGEEKTPLKKRSAGLPPSALKIALFLFIIMPILADLHYQFKTTLSTAGFMSSETGGINKSVSKSDREQA